MNILREILQMVFLFNVTPNIIKMIEIKISQFIKLWQKIAKMTQKINYLIHIPDAMRKFGPAI